MHRDSQEMRAVKCIKKIGIIDIDKFKSQLEIMRKLDHPNVIKLHDVFEDKKYIYIAMEYWNQ